MSKTEASFLKIYNVAAWKLQTLVTEVRMKASEWEKAELGTRATEKILAYFGKVIGSRDGGKEKNETRDKGNLKF